MTRRRHVLLAVAVIFAVSVYSLLAYAYSRLALTANRSDEGEPRVEVSETVRRIGVVPVGKLCEVSFKVRNGGERRLVLDALHSECECIRAQEAETIIAPGRTAPLKVTFQAPSIAGAYDLAAKFSTNDAAHPVMTLVVRVDVAGSSSATEPMPKIERVSQWKP